MRRGPKPGTRRTPKPPVSDENIAREINVAPKHAHFIQQLKASTKELARLRAVRETKQAELAEATKRFNIYEQKTSALWQDFQTIIESEAS